MNSNNRHSPIRAALTVLVAILGGELAIMIAIDGILEPIFRQSIPPYFWEFVDPVLLSAIVVPVLYFFLLRPMQEQQKLLEVQKDELGIAAVTFEAQDGVIVADANHTILKVNKSFSDITGYSSEEVIGKTPAILQSGRHNREFYQQMRKNLLEKKFWQGEIWNRRKNGEIYPEWLTITAVQGDSGVLHYVGIFIDITKRKASEEKVKHMAYHDRLTELPNRELFYDRLSLAMSAIRRMQDRLALLYLDLDGFKEINDNFGHKAGDHVLKVTSLRLLACIRNEDTVARLGGDEFAILLSGVTGPSDATKIAEKIIQKLSEPIPLPTGHHSVLGVSIGISICPENGVEIDRLMSAADNAMYTSKAKGKNTFTLASTLGHGDATSQDWIVLDQTMLSGITELDSEHLKLALTLNELNAAVTRNAPTAAIRQTLDELTDMIRIHFSHEDLLMDKYKHLESDISRTLAHKMEHQRLVDELETLKEKFSSGGEMAVLYTLKEWLLHHISTVDKQLAELMKQDNALTPATGDESIKVHNH
jgi:diguanylate cyclase (GGDEF)-like protein/PAS domain S-box-containing protein/hemerythrin-like metal-binding protein